MSSPPPTSPTPSSVPTSTEDVRGSPGIAPRSTRRAALAAVGSALTLAPTGCLGRVTAAPLGVGVAPPNRPFAVRSRCCTWETADLSGLDVDVAEALGDRLGRPVEFVASDPATLRGPPAAWSFDVAMDGLIVPADPSPGRRYVAPYLRGHHSVLVPAPATGVDALRGGTVGVASARAARAAGRLRSALDGDLRIERFTDETAAYDALGRLSGVVTDHVTNGLAAARGTGAVLDGASIGTDHAGPALAIGVDDYGVAVGTDGPLGDDLAAALDALRAAGRLGALREPYFTPDGRPRLDAV
jgi:cystine transport system permease protein